MIIKHPLATEKAIRMMESENKLVFVVEKKASKDDIAEAFEHYFGVKPVKINTMIHSDGVKRAVITLPQDSPAIDIATKLGLV